jgi:hypothetical protein
MGKKATLTVRLPLAYVKPPVRIPARHNTSSNLRNIPEPNRVILCLIISVSYTTAVSDKPVFYFLIRHYII